MGVFSRNQYAVGVAGVSGAQSWVPLDVYQTPFNVSFFINRTTGGGDSTCKVQHTPMSVIANSSVPASMIFTHEDASAVTVSADGNYAFPVRAIRLNITQGSGTCTYDFTVLQGDDVG